MYLEDLPEIREQVNLKNILKSKIKGQMFSENFSMVRIDERHHGAHGELPKIREQMFLEIIFKPNIEGKMFFKNFFMLKIEERLFSVPRRSAIDQRTTLRNL